MSLCRNNRLTRRNLHSALVLILLLSIFAFPVDVYGFGCGYKWWKNPQIVDELELSGDQVRQIEGVFSSYKSQIADLESKLGKKDRELQWKIKDPNSTREEILELTKEVEETRDKLRDIDWDMQLDIRDVLTSEQRVKLQEIQERLGFSSKGC